MGHYTIQASQPWKFGRVDVDRKKPCWSRAIESLLHVSSPPRPLNITGDRILVRDVAERFGAHFGRAAIFTGTPQPTAWHIDARESYRLFGPPPTSLDAIIAAIAAHLRACGRLLGKPTHFATRDGKL